MTPGLSQASARGIDLEKPGLKMNDGIPTRPGLAARPTPRWKELRAGACLATVLSVTCAGQNGTNPTSSNGQFRPEKVYAVSPVNEKPDANKLQEMNARRAQLQTFSAVNAERKRQMGDDSARLLQFAVELNTDFASSDPAGSAQTAMARAEMIEKLAHGIKEKMKLTVAAQ